MRRTKLLFAFGIAFSLFAFVCGVSVVWERECRKCKKCKKSKRKIQYLVEYTEDGKLKNGFTFDPIDRDDKIDNENNENKKLYTLKKKEDKNDVHKRKN